MHDLTLISTIAAAFTGAWVLGLLTQWLRLSPIVGYLIAGIVIGPYTPGFVGDTHIATQLAEVGVILLMFGVGLHFHLKDLLAVKGVAIPGAVGQSLAATVVAVVVFSVFGMPLKTGVVLGMAMSVASTVVLIRVLMDAGVLNSAQGHVAVGWLIVEDIFTVILLVLIPVLGAGVADDLAAQAPAAAEAASHAAHAADEAAAGGSFLWTLGIALAKLAALVAIVMFGGSRVVPWVLVRVAKLRSRELFTLTVLVIAVAIAAASYFVFGASMALGAFLAGMVVAQSPVSHQAAADALPMRDAFAVLFFVSVGMLFDPAVLVEEPMMIAAALGIIFLVKPLAALLIVAVLGHSVRTALTVALALAQIGEFSFILSELARQHGLMSNEGHSVLVASAIISITLNPLIFRALPGIEQFLRARPVLWNLLNGRAERRARSENAAAAAVADDASRRGERIAVVIGFGPVGRSVHRMLRDAGLSTVVIDMNMETVAALNAEGQPAIFGDATHESILEQAGVPNASHVVLTLPQADDRAAIVTAVRHMNPEARILVRARYLGEREALEQAGATAMVFEEAEASVALARLVLADTGVHRDAADRKLRNLRLQLILENMSHVRTIPVRGVMIPWPRVRWLPSTASKDTVLSRVAGHDFLRWPVVDPNTGEAVGYLYTRDVIALPPGDDDWLRLLRPLRAVHPDDDVESAMIRMQSEGATTCIVEENGRPVGLVTLEDILDQVVGQAPGHVAQAATTVHAAMAAGGIILNLDGTTAEQAIRQLAAAIPPGDLPPGIRVADLALARESEHSTDLGNGVAIPHARCPGLRTPMVIFGRSQDGILFSPESPEPVRLVFLLVTPAEQPEVQLALLGQVAAIVGVASAREKLCRAASPSEILDIVASMQPQTA